jgi:transcriptional regulator with XRE-family HTH domain
MTRLEQLRIDRVLTRAELSEATGVGIGTIRRLEEQIGTAQVGTLGKLAAFFGVAPSELLSEAIPANARHEAA